jgi:hypothetical protein
LAEEARPREVPSFELEINDLKVVRLAIEDAQSFQLRLELMRAVLSGQERRRGDLG